MASTLAPILRDYLVRYQQTAIRETGRRPVTWLRTPMDDKLLMPGCPKPGCSFWQPVEWPANKVPLGKAAEGWHESIVDYLSMCQFLEIRFHLPVAHMGSPLSFLYGRTFETGRNTESAPPSRAFEEALMQQKAQPELPLGFCMAQTCDGGEPLLLMLRAEDGQAYVLRPERDVAPTYLNIMVDRLLPKLQFVYDF